MICKQNSSSPWVGYGFGKLQGSRGRVLDMVTGETSQHWPHPYWHSKFTKFKNQILILQAELLHLCLFQLPKYIKLLGHYLRNQQVTEHVAGFTRNEILPPPTGWKLAAVSRRSHVNLRFSAAILDFESSSSNLPWQASTSSSSISQNIFRTFRVRLSTAWFQWFRVFRSRAGKTRGRITCRFCVIWLRTCSLFHKKCARSATWKWPKQKNMKTILKFSVEQCLIPAGCLIKQEMHRKN